MAKNEYREYAEECRDWARTAKSDQERMIFLEMAATWLEAATRLELRERGVVTFDSEQVVDRAGDDADSF